MASIIFAKILRYVHENSDENNNNLYFWFKEYEIQIKDIIETKLMNKDEINDNLKKTFEIILNLIQNNCYKYK
jgi:hypothetical protein